MVAASPTYRGTSCGGGFLLPGEGISGKSRGMQWLSFGDPVRLKEVKAAHGIPKPCNMITS